MKMLDDTPQKRKTQTEIQLARGRLRGALHESLRADADDTDSHSTTEAVEDMPHRNRPRLLRHSGGNVSPSKLGTPPKRRKREQQVDTDAEVTANQSTQKIQAETFVMKLFDRSLDLSKYTEKTPLYPICRAWMANQPRNSNIRSYRDCRSPSPVRRDDNAEEVLMKLKRMDLCEVNAMPAPRELGIPKLPTQLDWNCAEDDTQEQAKSVSDNVDTHMGSNIYTQQQLLENHKLRWKQTKTHWVKHMCCYLERNEYNTLIIRELYRP